MFLFFVKNHGLALYRASGLKSMFFNKTNKGRCLALYRASGLKFSVALIVANKFGLALYRASGLKYVQVGFKQSIY